MKTKIKRHSRSVISVILAVCMLVSCMTVGIIATDAAQVTDSEAVGATQTTVYYAISSSDVGSYSVRCNVNRKGDSDDWAQYDMTDTGKTMGGKEVYSVTFTDLHDGLGKLQFQLYDGNNFKSQVEAISTWTTVGTYNGKVWVKDGNSWQTLNYDTPPTTPIYSLSGNVTSDYIVGSTVVNTGAHDNGWAQYNSQFAINKPVSGTTNTYYVDIETQNTDRTINIGLAKTGNVQYAYSINGTAYDDNGEDYVVPSTGITDAMNAYVYPKNSGGSIVLQPDTSYRITIDQSQYLSAGTWGKITVTQTSDPKIRFAVGSGSGTVTAVDTTTSTTLASGDTVNSGNSVTFTATPSTDYAFSAWYSDSACTNQLSASNPYTVNNVQGNQTVYAKFTNTNWPPIDLSNYQSAGSSSNCQIYVSKSNALTEQTSYYFGGQADAYKEYELYKNGNNYWIELSQADVQKARGSAEMYYAFTTDKAFTGIPTSASVSAATNYNYAISSADTQDYNFTGANQRKFAKVTTNEDFREYIENIGILYNSDSKTYTVYYYGSQTVTESVKIYAKDGVVRKDSSDSTAGNWFQFGKYANTVLSKAAGSTQELENYNANFNTYAESGKMKKGGSITLTTTMQAELKKYYIRGYCINGTVYELLKESDQPLNASNVATATYTFTIPEDFEDSYLEITPIYFLRDDYDNNTVTFYVEDYDTAVQNSGWGNTLFADFFYKNGTSTKHLEGYPGQPLVFYGGRYFMQVATYTYATDGTTNLGEISGVTLNNGFWDYIHSSVVKEVSSNRQTYDYSNFHKIYVEKSDDDLDAIVFSYKYRTKKDNYGYSVSYPDNISINDYASGSGNGWDVLKDYYGEKIDLFGNVLTEAQLANDPVYVVSNGYVRTYEGQYATEWVVYDNSGKKLGVIPSSALLIDTTGHWTDSTYSDECTDRTLASYKSVYNTLNDASKALNRPVYISYEKDNYASQGMNTSGQAAGDDNPGNRLDGLWYYSRKGAMVSANIKIEYSNDYYSAADPTWTVDSFTSGTATGSVTGTSAYFTNTEPNYAGNSYYGKTETGEVLSDSSKHYAFEAATSGTWMLEGWYLKSQSGIYTRITYPNDLDGESAMDANATFVARFVPMPTGTLKISHKVETNSTYPGAGTAYLSLYIFDTQAHAESYMANPATSGVTPLSIQENVTSDIVIPARNLTFTDTTTQYAVVKLTTTPNADSQFVHFTGGNSEVPSTEISNDPGTAVGDGNRSYTKTISFAMQDILEQSGAYYLPKISSIDYISHLNVLIKYKYEVWYNYSSYRNLHDMQQYKVTGEFDANTDKLATYLEPASIDDHDQPLAGGGYAKVDAYWFKNDNARKNFINLLGPYENNFMKKISWNTDLRSTTNTSGTTIRYNSSTHTYTIDVYANVAEHNGVDLVFRLPYKHGVSSNGYAALAESDGKILYDNTQTEVLIENVNYHTWYAYNGSKKYGDPVYGDPKFVTAPLVIYNGDQPMGFKYWSVVTQPTDSNYQSVEYTKCYYHEFNLSIYQNSIATPIYKNITPEEAANYSHIAHEEAIAAGNANGAVITFMENSRNQYNVPNDHNLPPSRQNMGDRIYTDFLISYADKDDLKFQDYADGTYTAGLAIQRVALLDSDGPDGKNTDNAHYAELYGDKLTNMKYNGADFTQEALETFIKGNSNVDNTKGLERSQFDANKLDNKNRIQYYYSYSVRKHTDLTDNGNKNYVYRAFAFMKDNNGNVTMVSQPLYFTFYDMASIANAQDGLVFDSTTSTP